MKTPHTSVSSLQYFQTGSRVGTSSVSRIHKFPVKGKSKRSLIVTTRVDTNEVRDENLGTNITQEKVFPEEGSDRRSKGLFPEVILSDYGFPDIEH